MFRQVIYIILLFFLGTISFAGGDYMAPIVKKKQHNTEQKELFVERSFSAPNGESPWVFKGSRLFCELSVNIDNYGEARFFKLAGKGEAFNLTSIFNEPSEPSVRVWLMPPAWRTNLEPELVEEGIIRDNRTVLALPDLSTRKLLLGLFSGFAARMSYYSEVGLTINVDIMPVNFQAYYLQYTECLKQELPFGFDDIEQTTLLFSPDDYSLSVEDKRRLDNIRTYVDVDSEVSQVLVTGYSDNMGRRGVNNAVSERRAKIVGNYLLKKGVPQNKLSINWFGQRFPVASNALESGRVKNRRVEIKVIRKGI